MAEEPRATEASAELADYLGESPPNQVVDIWLKPGQRRPYRLFVGNADALLMYQAMHRNPVLLAAQAADPVVLEANGAATDPPPADDLTQQISANSRAFDRLAASAFVEPRYVPLSEHPADGSRPPGVCLWLYDFNWTEQARLITLIAGDLSDLESFRRRPDPSDQPASGGEGVRDAPEPALADAGAAPGVAAGRGRAAPRRAGRKSVAPAGDGPGAAGASDEPAA